MKRLIQIVAVVLIGLLTVAPALASLPCTTGMPATCAAGCPMAASGMGAGCPMDRQMATGDCPRNCCAHATAQAVVAPATPKKLKVAIAVAPLEIAAKAVTLGLACEENARADARAASPPPYLLNRVFRI